MGARLGRQAGPDAGSETGAAAGCRPAPYERRVRWLREIQSTLGERRPERARQLLRLLRQDLGLERTLLPDILYRDVAFLNLVDPISHDLLVNLARDLQCPKKVSILYRHPWGRVLTAFPHNSWGHKQGPPHCWGGVCHLQPPPYSCPEPHSDGTCRCPAMSIDTAPGCVAVTSHWTQTPSHRLRALEVLGQDLPTTHLPPHPSLEAAARVQPAPEEDPELPQEQPPENSAGRGDCGPLRHPAVDTGRATHHTLPEHPWCCTGSAGPELHRAE
ncbi:leucine-rich repeat-containing protein 75B isoform X8 [Pongo pygmaeus]|uniref:leucine-rich repeat-containing protein 75B isoform X8 n=1 Tax=Pongo pygmaeus TaxID=9600 RepID=UPI00300D372A